LEVLEILEVGLIQVGQVVTLVRVADLETSAELMMVLPVPLMTNMAFALLIIGLALVIVTVRNTQDTFTKRVGNDFTGPGNFLYWIVAIMIIGAIGYVPKAKPVSDLFLVLVLLVLFLKKGNPNFNSSGGFFTQFTNALKNTTGSTSGVTVKIGG
jgi:hypothetical protein